MSRGKELVKNTAIVAVGRICTKFLSFFLLPFYTAVLSTQDYGIVDLFNTYISLLLPLIVFQIEDALFRFMIDVRGDKEKEKKVVSTAIYFCIFQSIIFAVIFITVQQIVHIMYGWYLLFNVIISIFSGAMLQLIRGMGDNMAYAVSSFLTAASAIILNIILVLFCNMGADGLFITAFISNLVDILYGMVKKSVYKIVRIRYIDITLLKNMLRYSLPLVPNYLSWWVVGASDKSVVSWFLGVGQNGILSVAQKFSTAYTTFYSIFNLTWTENASVHCEDKDRNEYFSQIIDTSFRVLSSACLGIIAGVALVFPWLVNEKFGDAYYQIPIYMVSSLLYSVIGIYSVVYIALKKTSVIAKTSVAAAIINLVVNIGLIQYIGLYAASISSAVAYGVMLLLRYFDIKKIMKIKIQNRIVLSCIGFLTIDFITYYIRNIWLSCFNFLLIAVYAIILNRKLLKEILSITRERIKK